MTTSGYECFGFIQVIKRFWNLKVLMVVQLLNILTAIELYTLKRVIITVCELYLHFKTFFK